MWIDYKGKPLKWHYPVGVLFDLLCSETELPWALTVHFQGFPHDQLLRCPNEDTVKSHFYSSIKEANHMKHGDGARVNSLSVLEFNGLWEGLKTVDYSLYWTGATKLNVEHSSLKHLPVRILLAHSSSTSLFACIQEPLTPAKRDDATSSLTLGDTLHTVLPSLFPSTSADDATASWWVQGVSPSLDTPVWWLAETACHPDNFLYVTVRPREAAGGG